MNSLRWVVPLLFSASIAHGQQVCAWNKNEEEVLDCLSRLELNHQNFKSVEKLGRAIQEARAVTKSPRGVSLLAEYEAIFTVFSAVNDGLSASERTQGSHEVVIIERLNALRYRSRQRLPGPDLPAEGLPTPERDPNRVSFSEARARLERAAQSLPRLSAAPSFKTSGVRESVEAARSSLARLEATAAREAASLDRAERLLEAVIRFETDPDKSNATIAQDAFSKFQASCGELALTWRQRSSMDQDDEEESRTVIVTELERLCQMKWFPQRFSNVVDSSPGSGCSPQQADCANGLSRYKVDESGGVNVWLQVNPSRVLFLTRALPQGLHPEDRAVQQGEPVLLGWLEGKEKAFVYPLNGDLFARQVKPSDLSERPLPGKRPLPAEASLSFKVTGRGQTVTISPPMVSGDAPPPPPEFLKVLDPADPLVVAYNDAEARFGDCFDAALDRLDPSGEASRFVVVRGRLGSPERIERLTAVLERKACAACGCGALAQKQAALQVKAFAAQRTKAVALVKQAAARLVER
jgi:hypothetical protein